MSDEAPKEKRNFDIGIDNLDKQFMSNSVHTSKYTAANFLPKNLFLQLTKMANAYFLMMTLIQLYDPIARPNGWIFILMGLTFMVGISSIKEAVEDIRRH